MSECYDLIILGAGPAGLAAAIYAQRARLHTLVLDSSFSHGGQVALTSEVENYPGLCQISGTELGEMFYEHAKKLGANFSRERVKLIERNTDNGHWFLKTRRNAYETKTVILAMGASHRKLQVPGEEELAGSGVSYCATCDGAFFKGKTVAIAGGGDVAAEDALYLARVCEKVYLIHRRDKLRAAAVLAEAVAGEPRIVPLWNQKVTAIEGNPTVESLTLENTTSGEISTLKVDGLFVAIGIEPCTSLAEGLCDRDEGGYILAGEDGKTSAPGLFAAGDLRTKPLRQILTAAADGANCVCSVEEYLRTL